MPTFKTEAHIKETVNGFVLEVFESDPYYHVQVTKDGKHFDDHLLSNDEAEFIALVEKYKNKVDK